MGFRAYAEAVRPNSHLDPFFPFEHLRTSPFWFGDRDDPIRPSHGRMLGRSASLEPELHRLICSDARARFELRQALIERWFPEEHATVQDLIKQRRFPNEYEKDLREAEAPIEADTGVTKAARSGTFRRLVLEAYDYRCAATGWRVLLPGPRALVEAAHLIPWGESHDDRPSNGIALTPTYHRALDWHLIAPGPDMKWRVSKALDKRIPDNQGFLALAGEDVIFHGERHRPFREALEWRDEPFAARLMSLQLIRLCRLGSFVSFAAESSARLLYVCSATVPYCYDTGVIVATVEGRRFLLETRLGYAVERTPDRGACDVGSTQHSWVIVASEARHPGGWTGARPERPSDRNGSPHVVVRVMIAHSGPPGAQYSPVTVSRPADTTLPPLLVQNREARWPNKGGSAMSRCSVPWRAATTIRAATWTYSSMGHRVLRRWHFSRSPSTPKSCLTSTWTSGGEGFRCPSIRERVSSEAAPL